MTNSSSISTLRLKNLTCFRAATLDFVKGINVFVGENGTGKTHCLKALYALQLLHAPTKRHGVNELLKRIFQCDESSELIRQHPINDGTYVRLKRVNELCDWVINIGVNENEPIAVGDACVDDASRPVFIPAIDMMGHTRGFVTTFDEFRIDFDQTHRDIVSLLLGPERRNGAPADDQLLGSLESILGGKIQLEGERFYLVAENKKFPMPLVAEGLRKVATLYRLIQTGWLKPGSMLLWDEPEVNLNPKLMDEVVGALLALARSGVQVFLATHSYLILKEIEVQAGKEDTFRFFSFNPSANGVKVSHADSYLDISPNLIE